MKVVWMHDWFLDYRIPVYDGLANHPKVDLVVVLDESRIPRRVFEKMVGLRCLKVINYLKSKRFVFYGSQDSSDLANKKFGFTLSLGLLNILRKEKPDVVIGEGFFRWAVYAWIYCFFTKTKYVMLYERTSHTERNASKFVTKLRRYMLRHVDCLNVNGTLSKDYVISVLGYNGPVMTGHMVADVERISSAIVSKKTVKEKTINFLYIGQLVERKGIIDLLSFWRRFIRQNHELADKIELDVLGDGPLLSELSSEYGERENVFFHGKVDYDSLNEFWSKGDVLVMPTREDNWSMVVPESMAAGLAVITTEYNGCYLDLVTKDTGWINNFNNYKDTAEIFNEIIGGDSYKKKGENARELILQSHSPKNAVESILKAIEYVTKS